MRWISGDKSGGKTAEFEDLTGIRSASKERNRILPKAGGGAESPEASEGQRLRFLDCQEVLMEIIVDLHASAFSHTPCFPDS